MDRRQTLHALDTGRVFHKPKGQPYAYGCNREAIRDAKRKRGVVGIDLDINPNKQLTPFVHHQLNPTKRDAWFDPKRAITDSDRCTDLTDAQMARLRVHYQGADRPILTAVQAARTCAAKANGPIIPCYEAKFLHRCYEDPTWWHNEFVKPMPHNVTPVIMSLPGTGNAGLRKLAAAHEAGLLTMWLWRGQPPKGFERHIDLMKSRPGHGIYLV